MKITGNTMILLTDYSLKTVYASSINDLEELKLPGSGDRLIPAYELRQLQDSLINGQSTEELEDYLYIHIEIIGDNG